MYTPINADVYRRAFVGFMAGISAASATEVRESAFAELAQQAAAYAQEVDTLWGSDVPTGLELDGILVVSAVVLSYRSPLVGDMALQPDSYAQVAQSVIARVIQSNVQVVSDGISPNGMVYTIVNADNSGLTLPNVAVQTVEFQSSGAQLSVLLSPSPIAGWQVTFVWTTDSSGSPPPVYDGNGSDVTPYGSPSGAVVSSSVIPVLGDTAIYQFNGTVWVQVG
jgi:hypothetical protein